MLVEVFPSGPLETNAILLGCPTTRKGLVVDAPLGCEALLLPAIAKHQLKIERILLTHSHWDHIAAAASLRRLLQAPLFVHPADRENLEHPGSDGLPLPIPIESLEPDGLLQGGDRIEVGTISLEVIHTPGHSPGGVVFWIPGEALLISGDTLFRGTMGRCNFPSSDTKAMWASLKKLSSLPPQTRVIPGHGEETTIEEESWIADAKRHFSGG